MNVDTGHVAALAVVAVIVVLFVVVSMIGERLDEPRREAWRTFAEDHGLTLTLPDDDMTGSKLEGTLRGRAFGMEIVSVVSEDPSISRARTRVFVTPRGMPEGLVIYPRAEGAAGTALLDVTILLGAAAGMRLGDVVETGDAEFDAAFVTRGLDPEATRAYMASDRRRQELKAFLAEEGRAVFEQGLGWSGDDVPVSQTEIEAIVGPLESYAARLESI